MRKRLPLSQPTISQSRFHLPGSETITQVHPPADVANLEDAPLEFQVAPNHKRPSPN